MLFVSAMTKIHMLVQSFTQLALLWFRGAVLEVLQLGKPTSYIMEVKQGSHILEVLEYLEYCHASNAEPSTGFALIEQELRKKVN